MDLHYLKLFNTLAAEMNFSRAAKVLFISQPALSSQMKKLEDSLGVKLFDKVGRRVVLNDNGKLLFEYTRKIFSMVEEAEQQLINKSRFVNGVVTIGGSNTPGTYILPRILGEFKSMYQGVITNLHVSNTDEIAHMISDSSLDFAINGGNMPYGNHVYCEKLMEDRIALVVSPSNTLAAYDYIDPAKLTGLNFIVHENNSQLNKMVMNILEELGLNTNITMILGSIEAIKQAVSADLGVSLIPFSAISLELKLGLIKELKIDGKCWSYPYNLIYNKHKYLSPASKRLMELVCDKFRAIDRKSESLASN